MMEWAVISSNVLDILNSHQEPYTIPKYDFFKYGEMKLKS